MLIKLLFTIAGFLYLAPSFAGSKGNVTLTVSRETQSFPVFTTFQDNITEAGITFMRAGEVYTIAAEATGTSVMFYHRH